MATITEMPRSEQDQEYESPALIKFGEAMGASRFARIMAIYLLKDELEAHPKEMHAEIYTRFARKGGTSVEALQQDIRWARKIEEKDLRGVFEEHQIAGNEWAERLSLGHLRAVGRAVDPKTNQPLTSRRRVELLLECYYQALSAAQFEDALRQAGYLPPKKTQGRRFTPEDAAKENEIVLQMRDAMSFLIRCMSGDFGEAVQQKALRSWEQRAQVVPEFQPTMASSLLHILADEMRRQGKDIDLSAVLKRRANKPIETATFLKWLAEQYVRRYPGATFIVPGAGACQVAGKAG